MTTMCQRQRIDTYSSIIHVQRNEPGSSSYRRISEQSIDDECQFVIGLAGLAFITTFTGWCSASSTLFISLRFQQDLHAATPMIAVWDDHEVANDTWAEGAENHNEDPAIDEGDFFERRRQAFQAYFEWVPIRAASVGDNETIYRQFEFGDLVNLIMLDTRNAGRDEQLSLEQFIDPTSGSINATEFAAVIGDPNRSLLGAEQRT